jgi:hypothetical protein
VSLESRKLREGVRGFWLAAWLSQRSALAWWKWEEDLTWSSCSAFCICGFFNPAYGITGAYDQHTIDNHNSRKVMLEEQLLWNIEVLRRLELLDCHSPPMLRLWPRSIVVPDSKSQKCRRTLCHCKGAIKICACGSKLLSNRYCRTPPHEEPSLLSTGIFPSLNRKIRLELNPSEAHCSIMKHVTPRISRCMTSTWRIWMISVTAIIKSDRLKSKQS